MKLRAWARPVAVVAALTLSGCGALTPGTAAEVDGQRITMTQVDDLVQAQCDAADVAKKAGQGQAVPISDIKRRSLGLLLDTELSKQYADSRGAAASKEVTELIYGQFETAIAQLPKRARTTLGDAFHAWAEARAALVTVAARKTGETVSPTNVEALLNAGVKARQTWQKKVDVETDPRFSPDKSGFPGAGDGSVSKPASSFAKSGTAAQVSPAWVEQLPDSQKCG